MYSFLIETVLHTTYGITHLVADSALYGEEHPQKRSETRLKWVTRVPATLGEAQAVLAQVDPETLPPLTEDYRFQTSTSTYGQVEQRWVLIYSEPRQPQAQRPVEKHLRTQGDQAIKAFKRLCRTAFACEADAQQALAPFEHGVQATYLHERTISPLPYYGQRGRPRQGAQPAQVQYQLEGALAARLATRQALVDQHSCCILATHELDDAQLSAQSLLEGYKGQGQAERGFRFLKDPRFLASSLYLKKPERLMALLMVMTVGLFVYVALEYRLRQALKDHAAAFPNQKGQPVQNPTARWVFHYFVGIHVLLTPELRPLVLHLTEEHQQLLQLLGKPYTVLYS
jgi:transposase